MQKLRARLKVGAVEIEARQIFFANSGRSIFSCEVWIWKVGEILSMDHDQSFKSCEALLKYFDDQVRQYNLVISSTNEKN